MSTLSAPSTAKILDFAEFRRRRAARVPEVVARRRQFLWGWTNGPLTPVEFPARDPAASSATLSRTL